MRSEILPVVNAGSLFVFAFRPPLPPRPRPRGARRLTPPQRAKVIESPSELHLVQLHLMSTDPSYTYRRPATIPAATANPSAAQLLSLQLSYTSHHGRRLQLPFMLPTIRIGTRTIESPGTLLPQTPERCPPCCSRTTRHRSYPNCRHGVRPRRRAREARDGLDPV